MKILIEIELNRKVWLFQKAVMAYSKNRTLENAQALATAKLQLIKFAGEVE